MLPMWKCCQFQCCHFPIGFAIEIGNIGNIGNISQVLLKNWNEA